MFHLIQWSEGQVAIQSKGGQVNLTRVNFLFLYGTFQLWNWRDKITVWKTKLLVKASRSG